VLAGLVLIPDEHDPTAWDLRAHYFAQSRLFFTLGGLLMVQLAVIDRLVGGQPFLHPENLFRLPGVAVAGLAAVSRDERVHGGLALLGLALLVGFLVNTYTT
ncbi:MAG: hypothetical protein R3263_13170, partial [Myxococcota bacterium]|nr:hypothetical protein [Myxococcota bacterium]